MNVFARFGAVAASIVALAAHAGMPGVPPDIGWQRTVAASEKSQASGGKLVFVGTVTWHYDNGTHRVVFDAGRLENQSTTNTSGQVKVQLALTQTHIPPTLEFLYVIAAKILVEPLPPGGYFPLKNLSMPLLSVPDGVYYANLVVFEEEAGCADADGFCPDDFREAGNAVKVSKDAYAPYGNPNPKAAAVEYFHSGMGHYFVTAQQDEIDALDAGFFGPEWSRTGETWSVWTDGAQLLDVCRFFTIAFAPLGSHFYTANAAECELVKHNPVWIYEKIAFKVAALNEDGSCKNGIFLYRLFNNGMSGAPNHRYTTSLIIRDQMIAKGFSPENDNTICVPP